MHKTEFKSNEIGLISDCDVNGWNLAGLLCRLYVDNGELIGTGSAGKLALLFCLTTPFCFPLVAPVSTANQLNGSFAANLSNPPYKPIPIHRPNQFNSIMPFVISMLLPIPLSTLL